MPRQPRGTRSVFSSRKRICCSAALLAAFTAAAGGQQQAARVPLSGRAPQAGSVTSGQNALTPVVQAGGEFSGSVSARAPFSGTLSLAEAIGRGLEYNLGASQWGYTVEQAAGAARSAQAALMPDLSGNLSGTVQQTDLKAMGFRLPPGTPFNFPAVVGPFSYMQLQASLSQTLLDLTANNNVRSSRQTLLADRLELNDARDQVVLGVGGAYLGVIAAEARLDAQRAQLETANAILSESQQRQSVGALARLTVDQNQVQASMEQLQLTSLRNDVDKQKINLARMIGLPPRPDYTLADRVGFAPPPALTLEAALAQALERRADLKAAAAQAEAARAALAAAKDERMPTAGFTGSYGVIGSTPVTDSHGVFSITGTLRIPLWQGGKVKGDIEQANAAVMQRDSEVADLRGAIEAQVREAYLDLNAAASQVTVAEGNLKVAQEALEMAHERFQAGVINTVELIQAQEAVATAQENQIDSVYAHNVAKLTLARSLGDAPLAWQRYLPTSGKN
ncbi:MAG TPA: TolC family protein [Terriglobales bacterium]|nr:TolC family protein [Terriglobales bacterium]